MAVVKEVWGGYSRKEIIIGTGFAGGLIAMLALGGIGACNDRDPSKQSRRGPEGDFSPTPTPQDSLTIPLDNGLEIYLQPPTSTL